MNENSLKESSHRSSSAFHKQKTTGDKSKLDSGEWQELLPYLNLDSNSGKNLLEAIDRTLSKSREEDQRRYLEEAERLIEFDDDEEGNEFYQKQLAITRNNNKKESKKNGSKQPITDEELEFEKKRAILAFIIFHLFTQNGSRNDKLGTKFVAKLGKMGLFDNLPIINNLNSSDSSNAILATRRTVNTVNIETASSFEEPKGLAKLVENIQNLLHTEYSYIYPSKCFQEYVVISRLGKGGFGSVMKVQHKLDGGIYALKKIPFKHDSLKVEQVLREVKTLARLDHPNICRYYRAWLEPYQSNTDDEELKGESDDFGDGFSNGSDSRSELSVEISEANSDDERMFKSNEEIVEISTEKSESGLQIVFAEDSQRKPIIESPPSPNGSPNIRNMEPFEFMSKVTNTGIQLDTYSSHSNYKNTNNLAIVRRPPRTRSKGSDKYDLILYIQMQLYGIHTLKDWLEAEDRIIQSSENWRIFKQIAEGIKHIHSKGIIHRDLKPSNIFIAEDFSIKIGDFGLAKELQTFDAIYAQELSTDVELTKGVGTPTYASPEQLRSKQYDYKTDIYSLGIILFELFSHFRTITEKATCVRDLKRGQCPASFLSNYPKEAAVVMWLMAKDPCLRPSVEELLASPMCDFPSDKVESPEVPTIKELKQKLEESQQVIQLQEARIKELEKLLHNNSIEQSSVI